MFRMMKFILVAATLAGVSTYFLAPGTLEGYAEEGHRIIKDKLDDVPTLEKELNKIRREVESMDGELIDLKEEVIERRVDVDGLAKQILEQDESLSRLRRGLEKAGELLEEKHDVYSVGGVRYNRFEIEQDAELKFEEYKAKEETLANLSQTLEIKKNALTVASENLQISARKRGEFNAQVRLFEAEIQRLRAREVYAETVSSGNVGRELKTQIGKAQKALVAFRKKLAVEDRMLAERLKVGPGEAGGIDYDSVAVEDRPHISTLIDRYFGGVDLLSDVKLPESVLQENVGGEVADR